MASVDERLDNATGHLAHPSVADALEHALFYGAEEMGEQRWYRLFAYCLMPTHSHMLLQTKTRSIAQIIKSIKTYVTNHTTIAAHPDQIWAAGYFDTTIHTEKQFWKVLRYIHQNPVKAGLCDDILDWPYSSARWYVD
jgi:REP element-mobilizing transposase RayT